MIILLILYIMFLAIYLAFNVYIIYRVNLMRIKGDATGKAIFIYVLAIAIVIALSLVMCSRLNWSTNISGITI